LRCLPQSIALPATKHCAGIHVLRGSAKEPEESVHVVFATAFEFHCESCSFSNTSKSFLEFGFESACFFSHTRSSDLSRCHELSSIFQFGIWN
jgi:hypothetical protein